MQGPNPLLLQQLAARQGANIPDAQGVTPTGISPEQQQAMLMDMMTAGSQVPAGAFGEDPASPNSPVGPAFLTGLGIGGAGVYFNRLEAAKRGFYDRRTMQKAELKKHIEADSDMSKLVDTTGSDRTKPLRIADNGKLEANPENPNITPGQYEALQRLKAQTGDRKAGADHYVVNSAELNIREGRLKTPVVGGPHGGNTQAGNTTTTNHANGKAGIDPEAFDVPGDLPRRRGGAFAGSSQGSPQEKWALAEDPRWYDKGYTRESNLVRTSERYHLGKILPAAGLGLSLFDLIRRNA